MNRRHVLILMSNEHDPRCMGCSGNGFIKAPHLDALAARGSRTPKRRARSACRRVLREMEVELRRICVPEAIDVLAKQDRNDMIERLGGVAIASQMGTAGATPPPSAHGRH